MSLREMLSEVLGRLDDLERRQEQIANVQAEVLRQISAGQSGLRRQVVTLQESAIDVTNALADVCRVLRS